MSDLNFNSKITLNYDELARKAVFGYDQLFLMVLTLLSVDQKESANGLVIGSGTGMELATFGNLMPNWRLTGVDPSEEMMNLAKARVEEHNLNERIILHQGFVESLPETEKYDFATMIFVLRFIKKSEDKISLFSSISKRLNPGAKLVIIDQYGDPATEDFVLLVNAWKNFMKFGGAPSHMVDKIALQASQQNLINEAELLKQLTDAGFKKVVRFYNSFIHGGWVVQKV